MNPFAGMPTTGIGNPFASGIPFGQLRYNAPTAAQGYNPDATSPMVGSYSFAPPPRQQLARLMSEPYYGRGGRGERSSSGYTTSGPQSGRFGYGGGQGGWGRNSSGDRSSASGGIGMGGRGSFF